MVNIEVYVLSPKNLHNFDILEDFLRVRDNASDQVMGFQT